MPNDGQPRLIVCMLVIDSGLYITRKLSNPIYAGDPLNSMRILSEFGADEIIILDVSTYHGKPNASIDLLKSMARNCRSPLTFGGSIQNIEKVDTLHDIGFDKILIRSALSNLKLLEEIAEKYGSQSLIAGLDVELLDKESIKVNGNCLASQDFRREISIFEQIGVGEILIHDIQNQGSMSGFSLFPLIKQLVGSCAVPLNLMGGFSGLKEAKNSIKAQNFSKRLSIVMSTSVFVTPITHSIFIQYTQLREDDARHAR